jgi:hypothetical protein
MSPFLKMGCVRGYYNRGEADRDDMHVIMDFFVKNNLNGLFQKTYRQNEVSVS